MLDFAAEIVPGHAFANIRFLTCAVVFAALGMSLLLSARDAAQLSEPERSVMKVFEVALNVFAVWALSVEAWQAFAPVPYTGAGWTAAQQLAISLVWTLYAAMLIAIGTRRDSSRVRWQALALFGLVILKAVFFDLSLLALGYRIASFMALGLMLLGASFLYQRRLFGRRDKAKS
jgi:uncharacterized membrane protein